MPHICPRPCSRLATAAVFISVGVVQFVVGIILLRSKYVYLLAGPDFWTSTCNIAVGCLLGLSASVWKQSKKRVSKKHILRRNLLLALVFSALMMNSMTLGIYLLGEGNTLLSIRLENGGKYDHSTFASEVLAYAYVTSVCCPIVCIVVAIVSMSGSCFKYAGQKTAVDGKLPVNSLEKERSRSLRWVYTPELFDMTRKKIRELVSSSSSESPSDEDSENIPMHQKYSTSVEDIQHVLSRMAQGKRDSILSDSAVMLRQMDIRRKNRYDSFNRDGSYMGPVILGPRESVLSERQLNEQLNRKESLSQTGAKIRVRDYAAFEESDPLPQEVKMKRKNYSKSKQSGMLYKNPYASDELLNEYQNTSSKLSKHYPSQYKKYRERQRSESDISKRGISDATEGYKQSMRMHEPAEEPQNLPRDQNYREPSVRFQESEDYRAGKSTREAELPSDFFSPDGSDFEGDLGQNMSRRSSWAGEIIPINVRHSSAGRLSHKLVPVASPVVPSLPKTHIVPKTSDDSGIGTIECNSFTEAVNHDTEDKKNMSSFQEDSKAWNKESMQEYPRVGSQSTKKCDLNRVVKMASISEETNLELNRSDEISENSYGSQDGAGAKPWRGHSRQHSSSLHSASLKEMSHNGDYSKNDTTPKRIRSASTKALRKLWSLAMSENQIDFLDQIVDEDSLIGLSEEELIARQLRTRSIRKVVQQRMKEEIAL